MVANTTLRKVLANRELFAIKLGIPDSYLAELTTALTAFSAGAAGTGVVTYLTAIASMSPFGHFLVWLGVASAPAVLWPAALGGVVLAAGAYGTRQVQRMYSSVTVIEGKRSFSNPLSELALAVADIVFLPLTILIRADGKSMPAEIQQITKNMEAWGYDSDFIETFLKSSLDEDINASMDRFKTLLQEIRNGKEQKLLRDVCVRRMKKQVLAMGREIMESDGNIDFREQNLLDHYAKSL
jgi:hypothetical protein